MVPALRIEPVQEQLRRMGTLARPALVLAVKCGRAGVPILQIATLFLDRF